MQLQQFSGTRGSRCRHTLLAFYMTTLTGLAASGASAGEPYFEQIIYPEAGVFFTSATGINPRGDIVGQFRTATSRLGFLRSRDGQYAPVGYPGAAATNAWGIDHSGHIVGDYRLSPAGPILGFLYDGSYWQTIDCSSTLGAVHSFAFGVNGNGQIVGEYKLPGVALGQPGRAFLYQDGACVDITPPDAGAGPSVAVAWAINSGGDSAGYYVAAGVTHGWIRRADGSYETVDYPGAILTNIRGINPQGRSAGVFRAASNLPNQGFYRSADGVLVPIGYPLATLTRALGISANGDIVGDYSGSDCPVIRCAFVLWRSGAAD